MFDLDVDTFDRFDDDRVVSIDVCPMPIVYVQDRTVTLVVLTSRPSHPSRSSRCQHFACHIRFVLEFYREYSDKVRIRIVHVYSMRDIVMFGNMETIFDRSCTETISKSIGPMVDAFVRTRFRTSTEIDWTKKRQLNTTICNCNSVESTHSTSDNVVDEFSMFDVTEMLSYSPNSVSTDSCSDDDRCSYELANRFDEHVQRRVDDDERTCLAVVFDSLLITINVNIRR
jgi:hypothetical protein